MRLACTCGKTCELVWPPNASLYASWTCVDYLPVRLARALSYLKLVFFTKTENQMLENEKSANRIEHQNRKTEVFWHKTRKTDQKKYPKPQNRKSQCPPPSAQSPKCTQFLWRKKAGTSYVHAPLESNGYLSKFIKNIQGKKLGPQQQMYPQKNLLECFSRWLNQPSHLSLSLLFLTS